MRRIILPNKTSEINIQDVNTEHIIVVYKSEKLCGTITYYDGYWNCHSATPNRCRVSKLEDAFEWFTGNPKFHVL